MTSKRRFTACIALCITAILAIAVCGCDDLGAYESVEEYYSSFGDLVFMGGFAGEGKSYSVKDYFYNSESREDFLTGEDGVYSGVEHSDYVYVAIPFNDDIIMDSLAMYIQANSNVTVYINFYIADGLPLDEEEDEDSTGASGGSTEDGFIHPDPDKRIGDITVNLTSGTWNSFTLDYFKINGNSEKNISVNKGQYVLLQIRNNGGVRVFDEDKQIYVDPQSGLVLEKAEITLTNLLVRALDPEDEAEVKEVEG